MSSPLINCGDIIDEKYEIISILGAGGMGSVFKARQVGLDRTVAIKILDPSLISDSDAVARFEREGKSISLLRHNHIAAFYSYGVYKGTPYIAMEYLEGKAINHCLDGLAGGSMDWQRAISIARQICQAMAYAHSMGIVHRDLKPNNIVLEDTPEADYVKVVDFGLAKFVEVSESGKQKLTQTGALIGSVDYLSPEQSMGLNATERSDIYSLACTLFQMITGRLPFEADNPVGLIHKHAHEPAPLITEVSGKTFPAALELVIAKAMEKNPEHRYQSMEQFEQDLLLVSESKGNELEIKLKKDESNFSKQLTAILPALIALLAIVFAAGYYWLFNTGEGLQTQAKFDLKGDHSTQRKLYWLEQADKLQTHAADLLRAEVANATSEKTKNLYELARLYNDLSAKYHSEGKFESASNSGLRCVQLLQTIGRPRVKHVEQLALFSEELEKASKFALLRDHEFTKRQVAGYLALERTINGYSQFTQPYFNLLLAKAAESCHLPPSKDLPETLSFELDVLQSNQAREIAALAPYAIKAEQSFYGPSSARVPRVCARLASVLAESNAYKEQARSYLEKFIETSKYCTQDDNDNLMEAYKTAIIAAGKLKLPQLGESLAKKAVLIACARNTECWACGKAKLHLGEAYLDEGKHTEALYALSEGFATICANDIVRDDDLAGRTNTLCDSLNPVRLAAQGANQRQKGIEILRRNLSYFEAIGEEGRAGASLSQNLIRILQNE